MSLIFLPVVISEVFNDPGFWGVLRWSESEHITVQYSIATSLGIHTFRIGYPDAVALMDWFGRCNTSASDEQIHQREQFVKDVEGISPTELAGKEKKFKLRPTKFCGGEHDVYIQIVSAVDKYQDPYFIISVVKDS